MPPKPKSIRVTKPREKVRLVKRKDNKTIRARTLERDQYICQLCGEVFPESNLECDHRIPLHQGGTDDLSNTQTLCISCHSKKSITEFTERLPNV